MKKIAYLMGNFGIGGAEVSTLTLLNGFVKLGYLVDLVLAYGSKVEWDKQCDFNIIKLQLDKYKKHPLRHIILKNKLNNFFEISKYDAILTAQTSKSWEKILNQLDKKYNISYIIRNSFTKKRIDRNDSLFLKNIKRKYLANTYKGKNIICVSKGVYNDLVKNIGIKSESIITIYNPFDTDYILNKSEEHFNLPVDDHIIHVGRFDIKHKRQDILLKAYEKANLKEKLILLGEGSGQQYLEKLIDELQLNGKVILHPMVTNPYPLIKNAKLLVLSSDFEGLPRVLIEALILKTPVVSTNCDSGPSEILTGELANFLVPTRDVDALAEKMKQALRNYPEIKDEHIKKFEQLNVCGQYIEFLGINK
ncbi:glycosyltransferase [Deferribacterales bacterium Es71-Z0220]|jgi:glycosyltransferase involved in cell wall biosynthesis|uniref:glycosyltransferase n=1 Tax=Deferrivibrio essentukiensis TaxID=2880922 RepID=UPI001F6201B2|nr:glycosyltransferase [Deferrivibrio essentukiensis]MBZ4643311.1 capsular polysaccharide biosynthesis protein [Deferribacteraceae bacterium]MCB4204567.1 glycosyltransferase [Deferrivibrio essentukiensis]MDK2792469.1 hypothetical protein [Deferribacteres bacterium]